MSRRPFRSRACGGLRAAVRARRGASPPPPKAPLRRRRAVVPSLSSSAGRHLQFYLDSDELPRGAPFIVPYTDVREKIGDSQEAFSAAWQAALLAASDDYGRRLRLLWEAVFDDIFHASPSGLSQLHRGLPHDEAVAL